MKLTRLTKASLPPSAYPVFKGLLGKYNGWERTMYGTLSFLEEWEGVKLFYKS